MQRKLIKDIHKKIALSIMHKPKTAEELVKELGVSYDELIEELKQMLSLKLITASGHPLKYSIAKGIQEAIEKRNEIAEKDPYKIRLNIIIEAQSLDKDLLLREMKGIEEALRKEKDYNVYDSIVGEPIKRDNDYYSCFLEVELSVKDFSAMVKLMYFYGPVSVEVLKPEKLELKASELQDGLLLMLGMIQAYNTTMLKLMNKAELEDFYRKVIQKK
ncbi:MAG: hypothetical protein N3D73_01045 [Candidatus Diapherotrites archaeon]|nr:hypothetical protein [Candidatus Diapherotrites archaeon]